MEAVTSQIVSLNPFWAKLLTSLLQQAAATLLTASVHQVVEAKLESWLSSAPSQLGRPAFSMARLLNLLTCLLLVKDLLAIQ